MMPEIHAFLARIESGAKGPLLNKRKTATNAAMGAIHAGCWPPKPIGPAFALFASTARSAQSSCSADRRRPKDRLRLNLSAIATVQSCMNVFDQAIFVEGFTQEANRSRFQRSRPDSLLREGRDEDDRCAVALRDQTALQLDPAQTRHLHIRDQTRRVIQPV